MRSRKIIGAVAVAMAALVAAAGVAYAGTTIDSGDVGIVGDASVSPAGATLVRLSSTSFDLSVTADDGSFPSAQCAHVGVTAPAAFTVSGTSTLATSGSTTIDFTCPWQSQDGPQTKTFTNRTLIADAAAPLGRSNYDVTFGSSGMVTGEAQVAFDVSPAPKLYLTVNPRPASNLGATPGNGQVALAWTASSDAGDITDYEISVTGGKSASLTALKTATSLVDMGLTNGTSYCYQIRARYNDGSINFFSAYEPATPFCTTPQAPANYAFIGFGDPVNNNALNTIKGGQAVPLRWRLLDPDGNPVLDLSGVTTTATITSCPGGTQTDPVEEIATGSSGLQNLGDGYYQFNWKTPKATGCRTLQLNFPSSISFTSGQGPALLQFNLK